MLPWEPNLILNCLHKGDTRACFLRRSSPSSVLWSFCFILFCKTIFHTKIEVTSLKSSKDWQKYFIIPRICKHKHLCTLIHTHRVEHFSTCGKQMIGFYEYMMFCWQDSNKLNVVIFLHVLPHETCMADGIISPFVAKVILQSPLF